MNKSKKSKNGTNSLELDIVLFKNRAIALTITTIIFWSGLIGITAFFATKPLVSTSYYHANIQFRAGNEASYDDIFNQSLRHIVDMYQDHPNWVWTIECQGLLIEMAYERYPDVFSKIQIQNQRGQLEIIAPQYSHGLAVAYNYKDFADSIKYNKYLLEDVYNLTISNVIVLQEGQFLPAFPVLKDLGFDTIAISRDQMSYHNYFPDTPLLNYNYNGIDAYVMPLIWLPTVEGGVFHHQLALSDSERINTGGIDGPYEFNFNPDKMEQIKLRHYELEKMGNTWLNMSDWVTHCIDNGYTEDMDKFMPESHWTPNRHFGVTRWMGWCNGESDDGIVHSRNYYTRGIIQTAEIMNDQAFSDGSISQANYDGNRTLLLNASKHLWLAQVTDTSGVNPNDYEFAYMTNNTYYAQQKAMMVINSLRAAIVDWQGKIQINAYDKKVFHKTIDFMNASITDTSIMLDALEAKYGFKLDIEYSAESLCTYNKSFWNNSIEFNALGTAYSFDYEIISLEFLSRRGIYINNTQQYIPKINNTITCNGERVSTHIKFLDDWEKIHYSPSLDENNSVQCNRSDYTNHAVVNDDDYILALPISNGFLYNDEGGYAIITNNTVRHLSVKWGKESNEMDFVETEFQYNAKYEFILYKGSLENALLFANIINPYPYWNLEV